MDLARRYTLARADAAGRTAGRIGRPLALAGLAVVSIVLPLLQLCCSEGASTDPHDTHTFEALAGGGRAASDDPFIGGPGDSGPNWAFPGIPDMEPSDGLRPIAYLDPACGEAPAQVVITDSTAWRLWWEANAECRWEGDPRGGTGPRDDEIPGDSTIVWPDSTDPHPWGPPEVDFSAFSVVAVTLERALGDPRTLLVDEVVPDAAGTLVRYSVLRPGEDCGLYGPEGEEERETAPAVAVLAPTELAEPFTWERRDTTYSCSWEPDPGQPLALYYTDAPCDLGADEQILTTQAAWDAWFAAAWDCDAARWGSWSDSSCVPGDPGEGRVGLSGSVLGDGFSLPVDFDLFAVLVLRAGEQDRWGGGIWLTGLSVSEAGSVIEYVVIEPEEGCPSIAEMGGLGVGFVEPTVAVRVPLPLPEPIEWRRSEITISCGWAVGVDSTDVGGGPVSPR